MSYSITKLDSAAMLDETRSFALRLVCEALLPAPTAAERHLAWMASRVCAGCRYPRLQCGCAANEHWPDRVYDDRATRETVEISGEEADELIAEAENDPRYAETVAIELPKGNA